MKMKIILFMRLKKTGLLNLMEIGWIIWIHMKLNLIKILTQIMLLDLIVHY